MAEENGSTATEETTEQSTSEQPVSSEAAPSTQTGYTAMDWRNLPDLAPVKDDPTIAKVLEVYPDMAAFTRDAVGWRSEMSRRVRLPTGEATPEDWNKYWQQLPGYPKSPQGYTESVQLPNLGQDEEGNAIEWDNDLLTGFYEEAHANGLTSQQAQAILGTYARIQGQQRNVLEAMEAQGRVDAEKELQQRFGASLPRKVAAARNYFMRSIGNSELGNRIWEKVQQYVNPQTGVALGDDPDFIEFHSLQYERFGEPVDLLSDNLFSVTPTADEIQAEKTKALDVYNDQSKTPAERQAAWGRLERLNQQLQQMGTARR